MSVHPFFRKPKRTIKRVFLHCSASDNPNHDNAETITKWHIERGFSTIGYHFYIRKNGIIEYGRNLEAIPAAQSGHNGGTIAICLGGLRHFTEEQFETLRDLCNQIKEQIPGVTFHGHKEVAAKECPVFSYREVLGLDSKGNMV